MRRKTKWATGAAVVLLPMLATASPAAAAAASDESYDTVVLMTTAGPTYGCALRARHDVDSETGELAAGFETSGGPCQGTITIEVHYVRDDGAAASVGTNAREAVRSSVFIRDAGSTHVDVDYSITFDGCASSCTHALQTSTK
jgi:hypothetical protein